jgi:hypothetical protein
MKKIYLLALMLMCIGLNLNAQVPNYKTVIASTNLNILYLGTDNPVSIAVVGIDDSKISAEITKGNATIKKVGRADYIVSVKNGDKYEKTKIEKEGPNGKTIEYDTLIAVSQNGIIEISVFENFHGKKIRCDKKTFRIRTLPKPIAEVGNNLGEEITVEKLLENPYIHLYLEDFDFPVKYNVKGFKMTFSTGNNNGPVLISNSEKFTPMMTFKIKELIKGDKIYIDNIKVSGPDGEKDAANKSIIISIK